MPYLPALLTLLAAILGVFGKSWDPDRPGIARITPKGWAAIVIALTSAMLTLRGIAIDRAEKFEFRRSAHAELVLATDRLLDPFRAIYVRFKGPGFLSPALPIGEREGLNRLQTLIPAAALQSDDFIAYLGEFNVLQPSGDVRSGTRLPYVDFIALRTAEGRATLEKTLALGGEAIAVPIRTIVVDILRAPYPQAIEARPAVLRRLPDGDQGTALPKAGAGRNDEIADYKSYIAKVDELRQRASHP